MGSAHPAGADERSVGASGRLDAGPGNGGRGVGERPHHQGLVRREHHPQPERARHPYQRRKAWGGAFSNPRERNNPREASFSLGIAAKTRVAPRPTNRSRDSVTRLRAMPCRRKAGSTARKYTYPIGGASNQRPTRKPAGTPSGSAIRKGHAPRTPRIAKNAYTRSNEARAIRRSGSMSARVPSRIRTP